MSDSESEHEQLPIEDCYAALQENINRQHLELRAQAFGMGIGMGVGIGLTAAVCIYAIRLAGVWSSAQI